jgi:hypothetical protein
MGGNSRGMNMIERPPLKKSEIQSPWSNLVECISRFIRFGEDLGVVVEVPRKGSFGLGGSRALSFGLHACVCACGVCGVCVWGVPLRPFPSLPLRGVPLVPRGRLTLFSVAILAQAILCFSFGCRRGPHLYLPPAVPSKAAAMYRERSRSRDKGKGNVQAKGKGQSKGRGALQPHHNPDHSEGSFSRMIWGTAVVAERPNWRSVDWENWWACR